MLLLYVYMYIWIYTCLAWTSQRWYKTVLHLLKLLFLQSNHVLCMVVLVHCFIIFGEYSIIKFVFLSIDTCIVFLHYYKFFRKKKSCILGVRKWVSQVYISRSGLGWLHVQKPMFPLVVPICFSRAVCENSEHLASPGLNFWQCRC